MISFYKCSKNCGTTHKNKFQDLQTTKEYIKSGVSKLRAVLGLVLEFILPIFEQALYRAIF